jgi:hypothetical protein
MFALKTANIGNAINVLKPCIVTYTSSSVYVKTKQRTYIFTSSEARLKNLELQFIKKFRKYYVDNPQIKFNKKYSKHQPKFFQFYKEEGTFTDLVEIDINRAYPSAGKILGIIPQEIYDSGLQFSKSAFLIAIGSLYRKKRVIQVFADGRRKLLSDEERDPQLSKIWRSITGYTDYAMQSVIQSKPKSVYFYWCDALFVKKQDKDHFINGLSEFGFQTKVKEIERLEFTPEKALVYYVGKSEAKEFSRPARKYKIDDLETLRKRYEQKKK